MGRIMTTLASQNTLILSLSKDEAACVPPA